VAYFFSTDVNIRGDFSKILRFKGLALNWT